ncbi:MAG: AbrB family transcriptional regulator [Actinomycetota bacterium]
MSWTSATCSSCGDPREEQPMIMLTSLVVAVSAAILLDRLNFPAGALIGAMVAIAALKLWGPGAPSMSGGIRFVALIVIGWDLGARFDKQLLTTVTNNLAPLALVIICFLVTGWILAWMLWRFGVMDPVTAVLATSPGGLVQMGALTSETQANAALVVGFHLLRIVSVLLLAPVISRLASNQ